MQVHIQGDGPVTIQLESPPTIQGNNKNKKTPQAKPQNSESQVAAGDSNSSNN